MNEPDDKDKSPIEDGAKGDSEGESPQSLLPVRADEDDAGESGDEEGNIPQFVSTLSSMEQQVGTHVINALHHEETVAVLTTVVRGNDGQQRIVSIGLDPGLLDQVQELLRDASEERTNDVPCIGFHCFVDDRKEEGEKTT